MTTLCTEAVAEALTRSLAKGQVGGMFPLTETQEKLGVPRPLVYICGLVVVGANVQFTAKQTRLFTKLQKVYHTCLSLESEQKLFQLSPTLIPCKEAQHVIQRNVKEKQTEMDLQAKRIAEQLLEAEINVLQKKTKKRSCRKKQQKPQTVVEKTVPVDETAQQQQEEDEEDDDEEKLPVSSDPAGRESVLSPIQVPVEKQDASPDSWVQVKTKRSLRSESPSEVSACTRFDGNKEKGSVHMQSVSCETQDTIPSAATIQSLQERIHQLQIQLAEKESLLEQERTAHATQLQSEREGTEERMQALQLRLYISETRSRAFEEALNAHVEAVANNVALTPVKSNNVSTSRSNSKPLYSRVAAKSQV